MIAIEPTKGPGVPTMTQLAVRIRLRRIGAGWQGLGCAVECGSWLGASARALAAGLVRAGYDRDLHLYDQWSATPSEIAKAAAAGVTLTLGQNLEAICRANVQAVYPRVVCHRTMLRRAKWCGSPPVSPYGGSGGAGDQIEIFVLDAAKRDPAFSKLMATFSPFWAPGATVALLDFKFWQKRPANEQQAYRCQEAWATVHCGELGELEDLGGVEGSSARFFRVLRRLEPSPPTEL